MPKFGGDADMLKALGRIEKLLEQILRELRLHRFETSHAPEGR